jgi:glycosyltransferase involved in cell wall biosynthesis
MFVKKINKIYNLFVNEGFVGIINKLKKKYIKNKIPSYSVRINIDEKTNSKKNILIIDRYVPHFDKDAGSRTVFQLLELFIKLGFNVIFIGDDFIKHEPYTTILQQRGIKVLYGKYYYKNWKKWIKYNGKYIDYIILNRPYISVKYIDIIKKYTNGKICYYGHDLHFLRDSREYEITKDSEKLISSKKWEKIELSLMKKADVVYYFSTEEIKIIKKIEPIINCKVIPLNIFPKINLMNYDFNKRKDIIFVGNFGHEPNIDGLIWFDINIMPLVRQSISNIILYVIGSNVTEKIKNIEKDNIQILGYLDDNALEEYYKKCRICVVPLRYGAGVKGKLLEAMYMQIPVITTSIGAEGLPNIEECLIIENDPENFAKKIINMYNDYHLIEKLVKNSYNYIMKHFTEDNAINIFKEDFEIKG